MAYQRGAGRDVVSAQLLEQDGLVALRFVHYEHESAANQLRIGRVVSDANRLKARGLRVGYFRLKCGLPGRYSGAKLGPWIV